MLLLLLVQYPPTDILRSTATAAAGRCFVGPAVACHSLSRSGSRQTRIREVMIQGILATEMSEHGTHITKVDKLTTDFPSITHRISQWAASREEIGTSSSSSSSRSNNNPGSSWPLSTLSSPPRPAMEAQSSVSGAVGSRGGHRGQQVPGAEAAALGLADCDRLTVASALLHAADLSSPGRPFATCEMWVLRLLEEFKFQAEQVGGGDWSVPVLFLFALFIYFLGGGGV